MGELGLAVENWYQILEVHEVYAYQVIQYNTETGEGGLLVEYINTFLKLKWNSSGYPSWVHSPEDVERYVDSFCQSEAVRKLRKRSVVMLPNGVWENFVLTPCGGN